MEENNLENVPKLMPLWQDQSIWDLSKVNRRFLEDRLLDYGGIGIDINSKEEALAHSVSKHAVDQVGFGAQVCALPFLRANKVSLETDPCLSSLNASRENFKKFSLKLESYRSIVNSKCYENYKKEILTSHQKVKKMCKTGKHMKSSVPEFVIDLANMFPEVNEIPKVNFDYSGGCLSSNKRNNANHILLHPTGKKLNKLAITILEPSCEPFASYKPAESERQIIKLGKGYLQQVTNTIDGYCYIRQGGQAYFVNFTDMSNISHFKCFNQNAINIGASHYCPDEFICADKNGRIELNNIGSKMTLWSLENHVYSEIYKKDIPRSCCFGAHPKSILFTTGRKLYSFDARSEKQNGSVIFSCDYRSCYPDENFMLMKGLLVNPFQYFVSSSHHLFLCDERYPQKPILLWNHSLKGSPLYCDITPFNTTQHSSDVVILLGTQDTQELVSFNVNSSNSSVQATISLGPPLFLSSPNDCINSLKFHCLSVDDSIVKRFSYPLVGVTAVPHTNSTGFTAFQITSQGDLFYQDFKVNLNESVENIERTYRADMGCVLTPPEKILPYLRKWRYCDKNKICCNGLISNINRINVNLKDILNNQTEVFSICNICESYSLNQIKKTLNDVCSTCGLENMISENLLKTSGEMSLLIGPSNEHTDVSQFETIPFSEYTDTYSKKILEVWNSTEDKNHDNYGFQSSEYNSDESNSVFSIFSSKSYSTVSSLSYVKPGSKPEISEDASFQLGSQNITFKDEIVRDMSLFSQESMDAIVPPSQEVQAVIGEILQTPKTKSQYFKKSTPSGF
ncbi:uncharacterized protein NPIL_450631 [Nephila pilipes]|uniref:Uncharacterized protein n=1 Tax=Nephila pilipes TaxID=299642 RepID=A0A8X6NFL0_NEPPI|nr:uncharacterized protein NPIL_450631 [Nephila pilipes]